MCAASCASRAVRRAQPVGPVGSLGHLPGRGCCFQTGPTGAARRTGPPQKPRAPQGGRGFLRAGEGACQRRGSGRGFCDSGCRYCNLGRGFCDPGCHCCDSGYGFCSLGGTFSGPGRKTPGLGGTKNGPGRHAGGRGRANGNAVTGPGSGWAAPRVWGRWETACSFRQSWASRRAFCRCRAARFCSRRGLCASRRCRSRA